MRKCQILMQPLRCIDQPLQLPRGVKRTAQAVVELGGGPHRHGFAQQDIGVRESLRFCVQKRLMEGHQPMCLRLFENVVDQLKTR